MNDYLGKPVRMEDMEKVLERVGIQLHGVTEPSQGRQNHDILMDAPIGIFTSPFVQEDGSYTRSFQGAGLGLAIVKRRVELMGGIVSVGSTIGEGTTVNVLLPFKLPGSEHP